MDTLNVDMDGYKVGPAGQTLGELKAAVLAERQVFLSALARDEVTVELMESYNTAMRLLHAAYVRLGLPYTAP